jgi:hypothetical protein
MHPDYFHESLGRRTFIGFLNFLLVARELDNSSSVLITSMEVLKALLFFQMTGGGYL